MKERPRARAAALLFFSGACALIYQTVWFRELRLIFGASTLATAAVMAVFMGGLGIGSAVFGARIDRAKNPLAAYASLELVIAISAAASPLLLDIVHWVYLKTGGIGSLGTVLGTLVRLLLALLVLAIPTVAMGGTLPAVARAVEDAEDGERRRVSLLYSANTCGAVAGALLSSFLLLEVFGTRLTLWLTCLVNLLVGVVARSLSRGVALPPAPTSTAATAGESATRPGLTRFLMVVAGVTGGVFMLMELVWYRMLAPILGGSSYTFGLILAVALVGIGIGGAIYAGSRRTPTFRLLAFTCAVEALFVAIPFAVGDHLAILSLLLRPLAVSSFGGSVAVWTIVTALVVLPAAIVSGAQFPLIIALTGKGAEGVGRDVGKVYVANTTGSIIGSIAGGFGLIPLLSAPGCWRLVAALLAVAAVANLLVRANEERRPSAYVGVGATAALALGLLFAMGPTEVWRHSGIGAGRADKRIGTASEAGIANFVRNNRGTVKWEEDGLESTVALSQTHGYAFIVNGKADGHIIRDAPTQVMSGLVGAILHPDPQEALVIGLGTGSTAGWLGAIPSMKRVDVSELESATLRVAKDCAEANEHVLENPKVHIHLGDARETLLTTRATYDLVFSEPSNPYRAGISSLFTQEFYEAVARRLNPKGIFIQWIQAYEVDASAVATALVTLHQVFPEVAVWQMMAGDFLLVSTKEPLVIDVDRMQQRLDGMRGFREASRAVWRTSTAEGWLTHFVANRGFAEQLTANGLGNVNHDDLNGLEFAFARMVGHAASVDEDLKDLAARLGTATPQLSRPVDPIGVLEERWLAQAASNQPLNPPVGSVPPYARGLGRFLDAMSSNRFKEGMADWRKLHRTPRYGEKLLVAEMAIRSGAPDAEQFIAAVESPGERAFLRAFLASRADQTPAAVQAMVEGFKLHRTDPWVLDRIGEAALGVAYRLAQKDPASAPVLYEALGASLAAGIQHERRIATRARIGALISPAACAEAMEAGEPAPYLDWLLELRVQCYRATNHRLLPSAEKDLRDYLRWHGTFGGAIPSRGGDEPHPFALPPADPRAKAAPSPDAAAP